ncbi:MAG: hypothetical protein FJ096_01375 [Deltaproteobacteria bacterium]|nr:hypothetical protein [Deltaproteobacteria bacterium]
MLDPELLERLAEHPERNAPEVNVALATEGRSTVLLALVQSLGAGRDALEVIARRVASEAAALEASHREVFGIHDDDPCEIVSDLERALVVHPDAPPEVRDELLLRRARDPFFVLAAASHPRATVAALERAATWPSRAPVLERLWLALVPSDALPPMLAEAWSQADDAAIREATARWTRDVRILECLAVDPARQVRRAVASNHAAEALRVRLAANDPAAEVRARAVAALGEHAARVTVDSGRFAAALRAMQEGGALTADVAGALGAAGPQLDEEGAMWAARLLPRERVVGLVELCGDREQPASTGLAVGLGLRPPDDPRSGAEEDYRELVAEAAKALSTSTERLGVLTGKARLAAWIAAALAATRVRSPGELLADLEAAPIAGEPLVLGRALAAEHRLVELCDATLGRETVPPGLLELAWVSPHITDERVIELARRVARARPRGRDLPDDEIDLDPCRRPQGVLEQVVLAACRSVTFAPRAALATVALDSRRVRYVLTAMPAWRGRLSGVMLGRVLKQNVGALTAGPAEARYRGEQMRGWTERLLNDIELAVALAIGHITVEVLVDRLTSGRHRLQDGVGLAAAAEARAAIAGVEAIRPFIVWATRQRNQSEGALAAWLLLEHHDRVRPSSMIASAVDSLSSGAAVSPAVIEALAWLERRQPGRLETVIAQTPRGKASVASALARAYRALGGLRDERG